MTTPNDSTARQQAASVPPRALPLNSLDAHDLIHRKTVDAWTLDTGGKVNLDTHPDATRSDRCRLELWLMSGNDALIHARTWYEAFRLAASLVVTAPLLESDAVTEWAERNGLE